MKRSTAWPGDGNPSGGEGSGEAFRVKFRPTARFGYCKMCAAKLKEGKKKVIRKLRLWYDPVFKAHWCQGCLKEIYKGSAKSKSQKRFIHKRLQRNRMERRGVIKKRDHYGLADVLKT